MKRLDDMDEMPLGKHKGKTMLEVPARWLLDYYHDFDTDKIEDGTAKEEELAVMKYIEFCKDVLEQEALQAMNTVEY